MANKPTDVFKFINMHGGDKSVCWEWEGGRNDKGRPYFSLNGKSVIAYRVVYEIVTGNTLGKSLVRHTCDRGDDLGCCNPDHLVAGTHQQNMDDMKQRERHGLPHHTIRAIRKLAENTSLTHKQIGDQFGIARSTVTEIINGDNYAHVEDDTEEA